jgi:hypothetical protein
MKEIVLTPQEFVNFKQIAKFTFNCYILHGAVHIEAPIKELMLLGF